MNARDLWDRYRAWLFDDAALGVRLDVSRMGLPDDVFARYEALAARAFEAMHALEAGAMANPDEERMVGHYWLRAPDKAPSPALAQAIRDTQQRVLDFAARVHAGRVRPAHEERFRRLLVIGIGGSALGPQFVSDALGTASDRLQVRFLDNTDPDGFDRVLQGIGEWLAETLVIVISKSGGTPETRNGMIETAAAYRARGLKLGSHAVAITQDGSALDRFAAESGFAERFPMWDWVGGRTSETSAVGLLPAALQGIDVGALLAGAASMDEITRRADLRQNPAALLAVAWHAAGNGRGEKAMVVLPYKDRLALFSRYLQQLVMESLGKARDRGGRMVHQGLTVYGNKGSTDQHAYVQQLRDGLPNFFVTFIDVLEDRNGSSLEVEPDATSGDYLHGFLLGTRHALFENGRPSMTLTLRDVRARSIGMLIALYERAVGFYASLIDVNAYDQPGVEAGKKAAAVVLEAQRKVLAALRARPQEPMTAEQLADVLDSPDAVETIFHVLEHLAANEGRGVVRVAAPRPYDARFMFAAPTAAAHAATESR
jgi:glucose-6-phosphate isomerase